MEGTGAVLTSREQRPSWPSAGAESFLGSSERVWSAGWGPRVSEAQTKEPWVKARDWDHDPNRDPGAGEGRDPAAPTGTGAGRAGP